MGRIVSKIEKNQAFFNMLLTASLVFATIILAIATIYLWVTTKEMVQEARKASCGMIILEANRDIFFNDRMYKVRRAIESKKPIFESKGGKCTEQDVDDYIGSFETLHSFMEQGILDIQLTQKNFGEYVKEASQNKEIQKYINNLRKELNNKELYKGFEEWGEEKFPK